MDAAIERIVTWAKFRDRKAGKVFFHFNTHFDHIGKVARRKSARLRVQKVKEFGGSAISIITGDFSATPDVGPIQVITGTSNANCLLDAKHWSVQPHYGPTGTFNGFKSKETSDKPIGYIFVNRRINVLQHATLSQTWQGRFSSNHFPVLAVLELEEVKKK